MKIAPKRDRSLFLLLIETLQHFWGSVRVEVLQGGIVVGKYLSNRATGTTLRRTCAPELY